MEQKDGKKRKAKKLKYAPISEEWGLELNEINNLEEMEMSKGRFLSSGPGFCRLGSGTIQTTIRVWSESELRANDILRECLAKVFSTRTPEGVVSTEKSGRVGPEILQKY